MLSKITYRITRLEGDMGDSNVQTGPASKKLEETLTDSAEAHSENTPAADAEGKKVHQKQNDALDLHIKTHQHPFNDKEILDKNADA